MSTADLPSITTFPPILDGIAQYLSKEDFTQCSLVSKGLNLAFKPLLWRDISINTLPEVNPQPCKDALLTNGHLIRTLSVGHFSVTALLASSTSTCQNLQRLSTSINGEAAEEYLSNSMDLVDRNANLRYWSIGYTHPDSYSTYVRFLNILVNHQQLNSLVVVGGGSYIDIHQDILRYLPSKIEWIFADMIMIPAPSLVRMFPRPEDPQPRPYHRLRFLHSRLCWTDREGDFMPHLRQCPNLEALTIPFMRDEDMVKLAAMLSDAEQFPKLHTLQLARQDQHTPQTIFSLICALKGRIKHFEMEGYQRTAPVKHYCSALSIECASTLESIEIGVDAIVSCFDIQLIATSCAGLKKLIIQSNATENESQDVGSSEESLSGWKAIFLDEKTGQEDHWVCAELEELTLTILNDRWASATDVGLPEQQQQQRAAYGVKRAYRQLGRLTKLKKLTLGWLSSRGLPVERRVDMSLGSGLAYLGGLTALYELDYRGVPHPMIGRSEVEWMASHWPKLRKIKCKRQRYFYGTNAYTDNEYRTDDFGENLEPETDYGYLEELLALRPNLEIE
ncbi:MAG: hypothetical protein J3Q66DRAFT_398132 [Benniella sp.]|nr:MAG: hypothetical protein J3Q66DRAFT_398132 [Benniella sp.]